VPRPPGGPQKFKGDITDEYLQQVPREEWFEIRLEDEEQNNNLEQASERLKAQRKAFEKRLDDKKVKITAGDDLAPGVLKMVKVYLAVKRRVQPGDKMAGRHGNKGVISSITPVEDMPYLADGTPVDIVLNPAGRAFAHERRSGAGDALGLGGEGVGLKIGRMLQAQALSKSCATS
jgi:DNA-directed RNA polymerase subunit beta